MSVVPNHRGPMGLKGEHVDIPRRNKSARDPDTTVLAHIRLPGDGIGVKPPDWFAVYACSSCHDALDRRNSITAGMWEFEDLLLALRRTQEKLAHKGLMRI